MQYTQEQIIQILGDRVARDFGFTAAPPVKLIIDKDGKVSAVIA